MLDKLFETDGSVEGLILRVVLALVVFPHGAQKVLGWFGGYGWKGTMGFFRSLGIPTLFGVAAILTEFLGPIALVVGFATKPVAVIIGINMIVAAWMVHRKAGFFMNWSGAQKGEGFEYHILAVGLALAVMFQGGGLFSIDRLLLRA